jgi:hypothetical protein
VEQVTPPPPPPVVVETPHYTYSFGTYSNNPLSIYDKDNQATLTLTNSTQLRSNYLIKYDHTGVPVWATKMRAVNAYSDYYNTIHVSNTSVFVAFTVRYYTLQTYNTNRLVEFYDPQDQTTPSKILTIPHFTDNIGYFVTIIAKYNTDGEIQWANYINQISMDGNTNPTFLNTLGMYRFELTGDSSDNVYFGFQFNQVIMINKDPGVMNDFASISVFDSTSTSYDCIVIKYSSSGIYQWFLNAGPNSILTNNEVVGVTDIVCDASDNLYIVFVSALPVPLDFFPSYDTSQPAFTLPYDSVSGWFNALVKVNSSGIIQWGTVIYTGGSSGKGSLTVDSSGNPYIGVMYGYGETLKVFNQNSFTTPAIESPFAPTSGNDMALIKYSSTGNAVWATYLTSQNRVVQPVLKISSDNKITILGRTSSNTIAIYDPSSSVTPVYTMNINLGGTNIVMVEFDATGAYQKGVYMGQIQSNTNSSVRPMITGAASDRVYIATEVDAGITANFYDTTNTAIVSFTNQQASLVTILVKYDKDFVPQWVAYNDQSYSYVQIASGIH